MRQRIGAHTLALAAVLAACRAPTHQPFVRTVPIEPPATSATPREATAPRRRASGPVTVRLAGLATAKELELLDEHGVRRIVRRAGRLLRVDEAPPRETLVLHSAAEAPLGVGGARYPGSLSIRVDRNGEWLVENEVDLEDYVLGVVAKELGFGDTPTEAWRAQAIAARSYALANLEQRGAARSDPYLFDGVRDQAYSGAPLPRGKREEASLERLRDAVASTRGLVLSHDNACVDARYHASCGGQTADARAVFPELRSACLLSVRCDPCAATRSVLWNWTASRDELSSLARRRGLGARVLRVAPIEVDASRRWIELELTGERGSQRMRYEELRRELGRDKLRSARILETWPKAGELLEAGMLFSGAGRGHGAGLCQRGAVEHAKNGWSAEAILTHYYPGATLEDRR